MLINYLKVAFRSLLRNRLTSFINIAGLALAITCSLLIYLFIADELQYDQYNEKADRIYRVTRNFLSRDGSVNLHLGHVAPPFGPLLKNDFPDFEQVARTLQLRPLITLQDEAREVKAFNEPNSFFAEPEILDIFTFDIQQGNPEKVLTDPFHVMLSRKTATRYFGDEDPLGKQLKFGTQYTLTVSGVFDDLPAQSHWHPDLLISFTTLNDSTIYGTRGLATNFGNNSFGTYVLVREPFNVKQTEALFPAFLDRHMPNGNAQNNPVKPSSFTNLFLQKLTDIHLYSHLDSEVETNSSITTVYMMGIIGLFIILIACFNFINLSTARATKRAKEVGMRKVVGAVRKQLVMQYLSESVLIALLAMVIALATAWLAVSWLNAFTGKSLVFDPLTQVGLLAGILAGTVLTGLLAGIYPALIVSGFRPATILKGNASNARSKGSLRRVLVVAQFAISVTLIIATAITFQQLNYLNQQDLGYDKDQVLTFRSFPELATNYDAFYNQLTRESAIQNAARSSRVPTGRLLDSQGGAQVQQGDSMMAASVVIKNIGVDRQFFDTYGIEFVSGRNFSPDVKTDDSLAFVLNEAAVKMLGLTNDDILTRDFQYGGVRGRVIGVVRDFHFESLHESIIPMVFQSAPNFYNNISVKVAGGHSQEAIAAIEKVWREFIPHRPFEYSFLSERYQRLYESEQKQGQLFTIFAGLAIVIACLGLFGLATFNTLQRVKEIGIRKVLGASVPHILTLLAREIVLLVLAANLIAWPVAWYFMRSWLDGFAYRADLGAGSFVLALTATTLLAIITVSTQTIRAALTNPANTLRYE